MTSKLLEMLFGVRPALYEGRLMEFQVVKKNLKRDSTIKDTVSNLHFVKMGVKQLHILTANTDNRAWSVMWVLRCLRSAVNRKYLCEILSPDWTRVREGCQKMSVCGRAEDPCY